MDREDAIDVLHRTAQILTVNCTNVNSISLIPPSQDNKAIGYQLKIGTILDEDCKKCLMPLLKEKGLQMQQNSDHIIVYKPH